MDITRFNKPRAIAYRDGEVGKVLSIDNDSKFSYELEKRKSLHHILVSIGGMRKSHVMEFPRVRMDSALQGGTWPSNEVVVYVPSRMALFFDHCCYV